MRFVFSSLAASLAVLALGCGDNTRIVTPPDAGPDAPPPDADRCGAMTLGKPRLHYNFFNQLTGLQYPILDGDAAGQFLVVELYDESTGGGLPPLAPGSFDLAAAPNTNLATCQHCVFVGSGDPAFGLTVTHFQSSGSLSLTRVSDPFESIFTGTMEAELGAVTVDETGASVPVPGGDCLRLPALAFDTTPTAEACDRLVDCPNEQLQVCSPNAQVCVEPECQLGEGGCAESEICVTQDPISVFGACYEMCDARLANDCPSEFTCVQATPQPGDGWCIRRGEGTLGEACEPADATTGCVDGLACSRESATCTSRCNLFGPGPACSPDTRCSLFGRCEPPTVADPAGLGGLCGPSAELATACAATATELSGFCFAPRFQDPLVCVEACLADSDCDASEFCALRFTTGLGACLPDPVCGDGLLGEIGEVCDDGNTANGDTCSADCQTVDLAASCAAATPVTAGATVTGNSATALDGFMASCQFGRARTELYTFDPATPGRLTVTLTAPSRHAVSLVTECGDAASEVACETSHANEPEVVVQQLTTADPVTIAIAATDVYEEGPFTFTVAFVPEQCGDGVIAGNEACDDGNTAANDGCSADCRTVEYGALCTAAATLSTTAPNTGDTTGAPFIFENDCSGFVTGRDRLYRFTAPQAGTLALALDQGANDLAIAVFDDCGAPATMTQLACSSVGETEEVAVELTAGQTVTVVVDGFDQNDAGPYTLTATFP